MAHVTYADAIAIIELAFYAPVLLISLFVSRKHGIARSAGWIFITIFCIIRIVGAAAQSTTVFHPNSRDAYTTALVCSVLGLSPLLMGSLGLISRAYVA